MGRRRLVVFSWFAVLFLSVAVVPWTGVAAEPAESEKPAATFYPTSDYTVREIRGWSCYLAADLVADPPLCEETVELLGAQLYKVVRALPTSVVGRLRTVKIWVQRRDPFVTSVCYHPSVEWLREHGVNLDKEKSVDIPAAEYFVSETHRQPMMILHELTHAWHDRFLPDGYGNATVREAFDAAVAAGLYENALCNDGHTGKAYAITAPVEYFAELTEAFYGENDFFPFVRIELKRHDPKGYEMVRRLWRGES